MSDNQGGFVWRGGSAQAAAKDGQLSVEIVVGARGGLRQFPHGMPPPIQIAPHMMLIPRAHMVGGQRFIIFDSAPSHVRIYSKHRELRGDAPEQWTPYTDPDTLRQWEYMSGPKGRRLARWAGGRAVDIDEDQHAPFG